MLAYMFPGQGSQFKGMGANLWRRFSDYVDIADSMLGYSVEHLCMKDPERRLSKTAYTQPALYVLNHLFYLAAVEDNGSQPDYLVGHSLGEYNALLASGAFDFETGLRLVSKRGALMAEATGGGMTAIFGLCAEEIHSVLQENALHQIELANINTRRQIVLSGPKDDLRMIRLSIQDRGGRIVPLRVSGAFHSCAMGGVQDAFEEYIHAINFNSLLIPALSNVNARPHTQEGIKALLAAHIGKPVRWLDSIEFLLRQGVQRFVQVGPGKILEDMVVTIQKEWEEFSTLEASSHSISLGPEVSGDNSASLCEAAAGTAVSHPWLGGAIREKNGRFKILLDAGNPAISHHRIKNKILFPGTGYLELARAAATTVLEGETAALSNVSWLHPVYVEPDRKSEIEVQLEARRDREYEFRISIPGDTHALCAKGFVGRLESLPERPHFNLGAFRQSCTCKQNKHEFYLGLRQWGFEYGHYYRGIEEVYVGDGEVLARISLASEQYSRSGFILHPALIDCAFQAVFGLMQDNPAVCQIYIPFFLRSIRQFKPLLYDCWVHARLLEKSIENLLCFDLTIGDAEGNVIIEIGEFSLRPLLPSKVGAGLSIKKIPSSISDDSLNISDSKTGNKKRSTYNKSAKISGKIAVISVSGRFPGSNNVDAYWRHLVDGTQLVSEIDPKRWDWREHYDNQKGKAGKTYSRWAAFVPDVEYFDPTFFRIREEDAKIMDPQQFLALELAQCLFDSAGYQKQELAGRNIAVILGASSGICPASTDLELPIDVAKNRVALSIANMIAARISDFFDLREESLTIDTACSSSLVAIHHACRLLHSGECEMAIAGGTSLLFDAGPHVSFSQSSVLSDEPRSYVFDKRSKGFVLGEGAGLVLLKRYEDALADGDQILAIVNGSAVNNDGRTMGITTPNMEMQRAVIERAINNSGVNPRSITYLEAHGTGTLLGDPIEIKAASQAYGEGLNDRQFCKVGSVKANIGHTLRAAGVASFIKVVMMLKNRYIPPLLNCESPHPRFDFENTPFRPALIGESWNDYLERRRAAISSFGFGGTNCHVILEEFVPEKTTYRLRRESLPPNKFNRIHCWHPADAVAMHKQETPSITRPKSFEELIEAVQHGHISIEDAVAFDTELSN